MSEPLSIGASIAGLIARCTLPAWDEAAQRIRKTLPAPSAQRRRQMAMGVALEQLMAMESAEQLMGMGLLSPDHDMGRQIVSRQLVGGPKNEAGLFLKPDYALHATIDVRFDQSNKPPILVETKFHTGEQTLEELALYYSPQLQMQMKIHDAKENWISVLYGYRASFRMLSVDRDDAWISWFEGLVGEFVKWFRGGDLPFLPEPVEAQLRTGRKIEWSIMDNAPTSAARDILDNAEAVQLWEAGKLNFKSLVPQDVVQARWRNGQETVTAVRRRDGVLILKASHGNEE